MKEIYERVKTGERKAVMKKQRLKIDFS